MVSECLTLQEIAKLYLSGYTILQSSEIYKRFIQLSASLPVFAS